MQQLQQMQQQMQQMAQQNPQMQQQMQIQVRMMSEKIESRKAVLIAEMMEEFRCRLHLDTNETDVDTKLLRELSHSHKRIKTLKKQLAFAGLSLPEEDISYSAANHSI